MPKQQLIIKRGDTVIKSVPLPDFGEVVISMHDGTAKYIDTRTRELIKEPARPKFESREEIDRITREKKKVERPL